MNWVEIEVGKEPRIPINNFCEERNFSMARRTLARAIIYCSYAMRHAIFFLNWRCSNSINKPKRCLNFIKDITPTLPSPLRGGGLGWGANFTGGEFR